MTRILFGRPGDLASRHNGAALAAFALLACTFEWLADGAATLLAGLL